MVLTCPSCRGGLTAEPAPAPYVVGCPHCRNPLTVPAVAVEEPKESPFETAPETCGRSRYKPARSGSSGKWVALVVVVLIVGAVGGAVFLFAPGVFRDSERHQMDSWYSVLQDDIRDDLTAAEGTADGLTGQARLNAVGKSQAAQKRLREDYHAKYGADPVYIKPKDRARPNPMEFRYSNVGDSSSGGRR
jgi:hypothetical protein